MGRRTKATHIAPFHKVGSIISIKLAVAAAAAAAAAEPRQWLKIGCREALFSHDVLQS